MSRINIFSRSVNSVNTFPAHGTILTFDKKLNKYSGERDKALGSYRKMKGCILEADFEGQWW